MSGLDTQLTRSTGGVGPWSVSITGVGAALPDKRLTNEDLKAHMDTTDEWIFERTGIRERRIDGITKELAVEAAKAAIADADIDPTSIDHVLLATTTPDHLMPGTSPIVAAELGLTCAALDIQAVCSGWVYGLITANGLLTQGMERVLLIGSDSLSRVTDRSDRSTGILFGDGAGAAILERTASTKGALLAWDAGSAGQYCNILYVNHGEMMKMDGREVFRQAIQVVQHSVEITLERAGLSASDIDLAIPHQANVRIVEAAWKRLGLSMEKTQMVLEYTGNTSAGSVPLALREALDQDRLKQGDKILFVGFGAGMTWASAVFEWANT